MDQTCFRSTDIDVDQLKSIRDDKSLSDRVSRLQLDDETELSGQDSDADVGSEQAVALPMDNQLVAQNILSYLSADELGRVSTLSRTFRESAYDGKLPCNQHLNLKPYWDLIDHNAIVGFVKKCSQIKSLSLSWCGAHNGLFAKEAVLGLMKPSLVRLELSACDISDDQFSAVIRALCNAGENNLKELDVSSTITTLSNKSLQKIVRLDKLTR